MYVCMIIAFLHNIHYKFRASQAVIRGRGNSKFYQLPSDIENLVYMQRLGSHGATLPTFKAFKIQLVGLEWNE